MINLSELKRISLFGQLPELALDEIRASLTRRQIEASTVLFQMGDRGDELFIVEDGQIAIYVPDEGETGRERPIRIFAPGEVLGEMALIDGQPRSLSARAISPSTVLVLTGDAFRGLIREHPDMAFGVMRGLNDRIRYTTEFTNQVRGWIERLAEGDYDQSYQPSLEFNDRSIAALAAEFAQMAAKVQKREQALRQELVKLRIEIDHSKRKRQVDEITESDYFKSLRSQAKKLRNEE